MPVLQDCEAEISMSSRLDIFDLTDLKFGMQPSELPLQLGFCMGL